MPLKHTTNYPSNPPLNPFAGQQHINPNQHDQHTEAQNAVLSVSEQQHVVSNEPAMALAASGNTMPSIRDNHERILHMKFDMKKPFSLADSINTSRLASTNLDAVQGARLDDRGILKPTGIPLQSTFDDDASINFEDDSSLQDSENRTMVHRGMQRPVSQHRSNQLLMAENKNALSGEQDDGYHVDLDIDIGENWQEEVKEERRFRQQNALPTPDNLKRKIADSKRSSLLAIHSKLRDDLLAETPSRTQTKTPPHSTRLGTAFKAVSFRSPETSHKHESPDTVAKIKPAKRMSQPRSPPGDASHTPDYENSRSRDASDTADISDDPAEDQVRVPRLIQDKQELYEEQSLQDTFHSSRASDYPTSSDEELTTFQPGWSAPQVTATPVRANHKRQREVETDYDTAVLKTMRWDDLHSEHFNQEPRETNLGIMPGKTTGPKTLLDQLEHMGRLSEEEQKMMIRKFGDSESSQIGVWFIGKFQEDLKRLVDIRLQRRKCSMKFEAEIRQRQKVVEWYSAGIEDQLSSLKKGGGELIKGKDIPSRRDTPQKT